MRQFPGPPLWAEWLLQRALPSDRGEDIIGDLREEYLEAKRPERGGARADWWYLRQAAGVAFSSHRKGGRGMNLLSIASTLTFACANWLATLELLLHHPGYVPRTCVWAVIGAVCLLTAASRWLHLRTRSERWFWAPAAAFIVFGLSIFLQDARAAHFEGYLLVISVLLMFEGLLMVAFLGWPDQRRTSAR